MPQITVNEIDQSVVTRVVVDNRVKILIPAITSFGPAFDGTANSVITVNDVSDFNRKLGYTPAEFNPFEDDKSRIYARELMKRGSAVSVVRVNTGGETSDFDIRATKNSQGDYDPSVEDRTSQTMFDIPASVYPSITPKVFGTGDSATTTLELADQTITTSGENTERVSTITVSDSNFRVAVGSSANYYCPVIPGTVAVTVGDKTCTDTGEITSTVDELLGVQYFITFKYDGKVVGKLQLNGTSAYAGVFTFSGADGIAFIGETPATKATITTKIIPSEDIYKYVFAPQIKAITAKYPGSFGNNLFVTISQITTKNLAESYQYANITVYYVDQEINYIWDDALNEPVIKSRVVKNATRLETKRVSTNPDDPFYFEDVEFDFINIIPTSNARKELSIVWSNINAAPSSSNQYSGFPVVMFKYPDNDGYITYNYDACMSSGTDFAYSSEVLAKLKLGFKGFVPGTEWSATDINNYITDVYGDTDGTPAGIINDIYANIISIYENFTDPYIYDFDFITSGGFVYRKYIVSDPVEPSTIKTIGYDIPESSGNGEYYTSITPIHQAMLNLVEQRQDCIALFDVTPEYDPNFITEYSRMLNTSYGTMHFPWCYVADPDISGHTILMSPSYIFLYTFLSNLDNNVDAQKWFPPAGVARATARVVKKPYFEMGSVLLNKWQNDTTARVNPIMRLKQYGYVIYGQYTTLEAIDMNTHSALESLNVRLISNVVKKKIFDVCLNLAFEPNTETLWNKFYAQMDEFLRYMKYNDGVYDYRIVMDESTVTTDDINHLKCPGKVYIAPTRTAEFFDIDFIITEAGALFNN